MRGGNQKEKTYMFLTSDGEIVLTRWRFLGLMIRGKRDGAKTVHSGDK